MNTCTPDSKLKCQLGVPEVSRTQSESGKESWKARNMTRTSKRSFPLSHMLFLLRSQISGLGAWLWGQLQRPVSSRRTWLVSTYSHDARPRHEVVDVESFT
ncbi:hypothetical protein E2P81_ATG10912 [Venturia nashicola]|uniref:Uncharacterized protein n=1 Tax=Venturia nashicola TaxID=86259 RepID=A0A4Z1P7C0_9PEZI|nr:hypothetical protein E6O75_ATG10588 [Venturia nashicola]TLD27624.1 hypothetical protein E2P81_ATG10912 [Venturia nashicola]